MGLSRERENIVWLMEAIMKEIGLMMRKMELEFISMLMEIVIRDSLKMDLKKELGYK